MRVLLLVLSWYTIVLTSIYIVLAPMFLLLEIRIKLPLKRCIWWFPRLFLEQTPLKKKASSGKYSFQFRFERRHVVENREQHDVDYKAFLDAWHLLFA